jgi:hypothetical protein
VASARRDTSPKDPERTVLHRLVREHLATFLARRAEAGEPMPRFVEDELRGYLRCGVLAHGAVRFACSSCGEDRLVGLSCKGRGFCPRCLGRRMTETARHWVDAVLPQVRTRQWVLSLPFELRVPLRRVRGVSPGNNRASRPDARGARRDGAGDRRLLP